MLLTPPSAPGRRRAPHTTTQRFAARTIARAAPRYSHPPTDTTSCRPRHVSLTALAPRKPTLAPPHAPPLTPLLHSSHSPTHLERRRGPRSAPALAGGEPVPSKPPAHFARPPNSAQFSRRRLYLPATALAPPHGAHPASRPAPPIYRAPLSRGSTGLRLGGLLHRVSAAAQPFTAAAVTAVATSPPPPSPSPPPPPPPPSPSPPPPSPPARGGDKVVPRNRGRVRAYI